MDKAIFMFLVEIFVSVVYNKVYLIRAKKLEVDDDY